ncbi:uncharacterized protein V1513DRAFT_432125 [Lipomyces chichibuensis]|uniref:uncharacterized protein n=1 Tax=Lipomyces chichibuensis TaxID=1546026 RepID=UPI00334388CC
MGVDPRRVKVVCQQQEVLTNEETAGPKEADEPTPTIDALRLAHKNMATLNAYQRRMSAGSSNGGSIGMLANGTSKGGSSSSPTMHSASLPAFGSVYIRVVDDTVGSFQYMIPIAEVTTYPLLFGMVRKLNTNKRIFEGDHAFNVHVDEDGHPGAIILERFWDKVVRDGLRVIITYKSGTAPQNNLPIDKALSSGLGSLKDQDDVFFPHYT